MPVPEDPEMKTDSRRVQLGDWVFFTGWGDLEQIKTPELMNQIKGILDDVNPRVDRYGMIPKVFSDPGAAVIYYENTLDCLNPHNPHNGEMATRGGYASTKK